jgi:hypothetical protein
MNPRIFIFRLFLSLPPLAAIFCFRSERAKNLAGKIASAYSDLLIKPYFLLRKGSALCPVGRGPILM